MYLNKTIAAQDPLREAITRYYHSDETTCINELLASLQFTPELESQIRVLAEQLVTTVRAKEAGKKGVEALMVHYDLSTQEGIMLMCLAEALLRIPDKETENLLIRDKLSGAEWHDHLNRAESSFVNVATWGLALTGKLLHKDPEAGSFKQMWQTLVRRSSEPVVRTAVREAIKVMSEQFVLGREMTEALKASHDKYKPGYTFSYDMLGEAARTMVDADAYLIAYEQAITALSKAVDNAKSLIERPSISVKLSAIYPRYSFLHQELAESVLVKRLTQLALQAKAAGICLTVDAEETDRLDLSLSIIAAVFADPELKDWNGLGMAVQAYQKRAPSVLRWAADLARQHHKQIQVRLVKGAYWDSEIKRAQESGYQNYPVFTRKMTTDVSYLACAKLLLTEMQDAIYPQFATHNAYTVSAILTLIKNNQPQASYEFQSLHGMGDALHDQLVDQGILCRVYAPVGSHEALLPYLVRRLLENGANSSFVNQIADKTIPLEKLIGSPVAALSALDCKANPSIPLPRQLYGESRLNSFGIDFTDYNELRTLQEQMTPFWTKKYNALPALRKSKDEHVHSVLNPANYDDIVGSVVYANEADVDAALQRAAIAFKVWDHTDLAARADILVKIADLLEAHYAELIVLCVREAGKVLTDAIAEVREAIDFCRYYAVIARQTLAPKELIGYTGESNTLRMRGRGVMLCISPWNFPVAIFIGQVVAALVAGNCVIAKPAEQTSLVAHYVVDLCHKAGVPVEVLQCLPGLGEVVGKKLVADERIAGVLFTGSTATAKAIQLGLAERKGPIVPFIAETGGINAMIADSTALPEQLIDNVMSSAFGSAGQRCSALRVLFLQDDIADKTIAMLKGAMQLLVVGDPVDMSSDIGPVIDAESQRILNSHIQKMRLEATLIAHGKLSTQVNDKSTYVIPHAFELTSLSELTQEFFGPILHVIRYKRDDLDNVIDDINAMGYGLTFGIQSRINETIDYIQSRVNAGNIYVNRTIIGAVVGVQPFGGSRLSGTGPKAGGPHYLLRLCEESTLTINTTAAGGNASLMAIE